MTNPYTDTIVSKVGPDDTLVRADDPNGSAVYDPARDYRLVHGSHTRARRDAARSFMEASPQ